MLAYWDIKSQKDIDFSAEWLRFQHHLACRHAPAWHSMGTVLIQGLNGDHPFGVAEPLNSRSLTLTNQRRSCRYID
ncbi:Uncharacterized protein TSPI_11023 [Trichinella spiralis]|uniref:Uncharacterized protein n=1 Tax=Trichinella spiralis TaxID=6334 RepID=A0ABR3KPN2_TRISP